VATGRQGPLEDEIRRLRRIIGDLEAVNIVAPAGLKYRYLVGVVEACQEAGIRQINFVGGSKKG
jgi:biopolymer transport protein ExbD